MLCEECRQVALMSPGYCWEFGDRRDADVALDFWAVEGVLNGGQEMLCTQ